MPLRIGRKIKKGHVFLLVAGIDHVGLMTAKFRPVEYEPEEDQVRDEGDPHSFTAARTRAFVLEPVNQVQEFIRLQLFVARPLTFEERLRRPAGRAGWNFSSGHWQAMKAAIPVSYTHLDVYKRQALCHAFGLKTHCIWGTNIAFALLPGLPSGGITLGV